MQSDDGGRRSRSIELRVARASGRATLWEALAPKTTAAILEALPLELDLLHCKWSGRACFVDFPLRAGSLQALESPVTSIYPGVLVLRPPPSGGTHAELLIAYGDAEFRWPDGRRYVTPFAEFEPGCDALLDALVRTGSEGKTRLRIASVEEPS